MTALDADTTTGRYAPSPDPHRPARARRGPGGTAARRLLTPYLFLAVPVGLLVLLTYVPVVHMLGYSVTDWDGLARSKELVGLDNYVEIVTDPQNLRVFQVSLYYLAGSVVQLVLALYLATVLSYRVRLKNLWKGILFFPYLINGVAVGLVFLNFLKPGGGLDTVLLSVGLESWIHQWTGDPAIANVTLAAVSVWRYAGLNLVMFLGAIASIDPQVYEAAQLDGAGRWDEFRHVVLPSIRPVVGLSFVLAVSGALSVFEIPYVMTNGGNGTETFVIRTVWMAFNRNMVGLASAMAVVLLVVVLLMTWVQRRVVPDEEVELR